MRTPDQKMPKQRHGAKRRRSPPRWYWQCLRLAVVAYVALLLTMCYLEDRLVYPGVFAESAKLSVPAAIDVDDPAALSTAVGQVQTVRYGVGDAQVVDSIAARLAGDNPSNTAAVLANNDVSDRGSDATAGGLPGRMRLLPESKRSRDWVVFFHGNGIRAVDLDRWIARHGDAYGANVFAAEYRGFTDDRPVSQTGVISDGIAAVQFLIDRFDVPSRRMVYWGNSLGGGVAAAVAVRYPPAALVMDRTFDSAVNVAWRRYWYLPVPLLMKNRFDSAARLQLFDRPLVVVHGPDDQLVPYAAGRRLYKAATTTHKRFIDAPTLGHLDPMSDETLQQVVSATGELIRSHASGREPPESPASRVDKASRMHHPRGRESRPIRTAARPKFADRTFICVKARGQRIGFIPRE